MFLPGQGTSFFDIHDEAMTITDVIHEFELQLDLGFNYAINCVNNKYGSSTDYCINPIIYGNIV